MTGLPKRFRTAGVVTAAFLSAALGDVSAQKASPAPDDAGFEGKATAGEERMTQAQKIAWVGEQAIAAQQVYRRVLSMLEQAKKEKDSIKISCLEDKLTQLEVNIQGIEERKMLFDEASSKGDTSGADQQFTVLNIYISRVQSLMAEAENCIGEGDVVVGESETILTIDDDVTGEDPTEPTDFPIAIDQPIHASGYY